MATLRPPLLIIFGGLPATGKTTISRGLTIRLIATYIRIDAIEWSLRGAGLAVGTMGYAIANALAAENLKLGRIVIVDCVNPVLASRVGWRQTASLCSANIAEIELVCSDVALHRRREESRSSDLGCYQLPAWDEVANRAYEPWDREHLVLDTANSSLDHLIGRAEAYVRGKIA